MVCEDRRKPASEAALTKARTYTPPEPPKAVRRASGGSQKVREKKPTRPLRSYPMELVVEAATLKQSMTWDQVAAKLGVPREGIRYAVTHYDYPKPEPLRPDHAGERFLTAVGRARATITVLENGIQAAEAAIAGLREFLDSVEK